MAKVLSLLTLCIIIITSASAQTAKWGVLTAADVRLQQVPFDSAAQAVVLFSSVGYGHTIKYNFLELQVHQRIKVLKRNPLLPGAAIVLSEAGSEWHKQIQGLQIQTLAPAASGETVVTKLNADDYIVSPTRNPADGVLLDFFSLPVGTIVEVKYSLMQPSLLDQLWVLESRLPVLYTEVYPLHKANRIKHAMNYLLQGPLLVKKYGVDRALPEVISLSNLPASQECDYVYACHEYYNRLVFLPPAEPTETVTDYWLRHGRLSYQQEHINYVENETFFQEILEMESLHFATERETVAGLTKWVQQQLKWDTTTTYYPAGRYTLKSLLSGAPACGADMNLVLIGLLRGAGIPALPALVRLRSKGKPLPHLKTIRQFHHLIAYVPLQDDTLWIDASLTGFPQHLLPLEAANYAAFIPDRKNPRWESIPFPESGAKLVVQSDPQQPSSFTAQLKVYGYEAHLLKVNLATSKDTLAVLNRYLHFSPERYASVAMMEDTVEGALFIEMQYQLQLSNTKATTFLPLPAPSCITAGMLRKESRDFPIELAYPATYQASYLLTLPDSVRLTSVPEQINKQFPEAGYEVRALYQQSATNQITLSLKQSFTATLLPTSFYSTFRRLQEVVNGYGQLRISATAP